MFELAKSRTARPAWIPVIKLGMAVEEVAVERRLDERGRHARAE